jgi:hypothetical protein
MAVAKREARELKNRLRSHAKTESRSVGPVDDESVGCGQVGRAFGRDHVATTECAWTQAAAAGFQSNLCRKQALNR